MSCCRVFLQRAPHSAIRPIPSLYRTPFRTANLNLTLTHKVVLLRAYSQTTGRPIKQTQSTTSAPRDQKPAAQSIYTRPEPNRKYGTALTLSSPPTPTDITDQSPLLLVFPERVIIYHAGSGRVMYLAVLKLTTIFLAVLFCGILVPSYLADGKPTWQTAGRKFPILTPNLFPPYKLTIPLPPPLQSSSAASSPSPS